MTRKCIISAVVMFVMAWALSFVVHGWLLAVNYAATPGMRPPAEAQATMERVRTAVGMKPRPVA